MTDLQNIRNSRRKETAEDFTPECLINEMLDKFHKNNFTDPFKTFLDNSAGDGNFLVEVLRRKLANSHPPLQAISTIYGVEFMPDNVEEMKQRLLDLLPELDDTQKQQAIDILNHNIVCHDALTWDYENWRAPRKAHAKSLF